jgi:hypothetical protein
VAKKLKFAHRFKSGALCEVEIDLDAVRDNTFRPHFRWNGRKHKARELIAWVRSVFADVASRTGVPIVCCFVRHGSGSSETWLFPPNETPRRIARRDEPTRNPVCALVLAMRDGAGADRIRRGYPCPYPLLNCHPPPMLHHPLT